MEASNQTSPPPSPQQNKILPQTGSRSPDGGARGTRVDTIGAILFIVIGVVGFLDATYLTIERFRGVIPPCAIGGGCTQVLLSSYSQVGVVPISVFGMVYYTVVIVGALLFFDLRKIHFLHLLAAFTMLGIFASAYFLYLQIFVIQALCFYCLVSAATSTLLFLNGLFVYWKTK